jgi:hypothetical protein
MASEVPFSIQSWDFLWVEIVGGGKHFFVNCLKWLCPCSGSDSYFTGPRQFLHLCSLAELCAHAETTSHLFGLDPAEVLSLEYLHIYTMEPYLWTCSCFCETVLGYKGLWSSSFSFLSNAPLLYHKILTDFIIAYYWGATRRLQLLISGWSLTALSSFELLPTCFHLPLSLLLNVYNKIESLSKHKNLSLIMSW